MLLAPLVAILLLGRVSIAQAECTGYTVGGAGSEDVDGCYRPAGGQFVLDDTHALYAWDGVWRLGDSGSKVYYEAGRPSKFPPESSGGCGDWFVQDGSDPCPAVKRSNLPPVPPTPPPTIPPSPRPPPTPAMKLVWEDDFDGPDLNTSRWRVLERL